MKIVNEERLTVPEGLAAPVPKVAVRQLEAWFGPLSPSAQQRLESLSPEQLEALALALREARSLQELGLEA